MRKLRKPAAALLLAAVLVCSVAMTTASVRASGDAAQQQENSQFCDHLQAAIDWLAAHPSPAHDWLRHILEHIYAQYC